VPKSRELMKAQFVFGQTKPVDLNKVAQVTMVTALLNIREEEMESLDTPT